MNETAKDNLKVDDDKLKTGGELDTNTNDNTIVGFFRSLFNKNNRKNVNPSRSAPNTPGFQPVRASSMFFSPKNERTAIALPDITPLKLFNEVDLITQRYQEKLCKDEEKTQRTREMAARKEREKQLYDRKREDTLKEVGEEWLLMIPKWKECCASSRVRALVLEYGVPSHVRSRVWTCAIGNPLLITREYYDILVAKAFDHNICCENRRKIEKTMNDVLEHRRTNSQQQALLRDICGYFATIENDLTRTYPSLAFFERESYEHTQLKILLQVYCCHRPDIGYVQGMSYMAAHLLLYMKPFEAFVAFSNMLNTRFFHAFLRLDNERMQPRINIFNTLLDSELNELSNHLKSIDLDPKLYVVEWLMTLFCSKLNLSIISHIWDCYFIYGESFLYRTAVAILKVLQDQLLHARFDKCMSVLNEKTMDITLTQIQQAIQSIKILASLQTNIEDISSTS